MDKELYASLEQELRRAGATEIEADELTSLAARLRQLDDIISPIASESTPSKRSAWRNILFPGSTTLAGVALGMFLVIIAQSVLPSSLLFPVQRLSDNVAITIRPDYRGLVMMRRAQQVKQLLAQHAATPVVMATLADYRQQAKAYRLTAASYPAFEYCRHNLEQAAAIAPAQVRQAINSTLLTLDHV